jgi:hypothetical protein
MNIILKEKLNVINSILAHSFLLKIQIKKNRFNPDKYRYEKRFYYIIKI